MVQAVVTVQRGVDLLVRERNDVDPQRIAYVGHSYDELIGSLPRLPTIVFALPYLRLDFLA